MALTNLDFTANCMSSIVATCSSDICIVMNST